MTDYSQYQPLIDRPAPKAEDPMYFVHVKFDPFGKTYLYRCTEVQWHAIGFGDQVQVNSPYTGKTWVVVVDKSHDARHDYEWESIIGYRRRINSAQPDLITADGLAVEFETYALNAGKSIHISMDRAIQETSHALCGVPVTGVLIDEMLDDYTNRTTSTTTEFAMIEITNTTFVDLGDGNGKRDISKMSDATVFEAIARTEQEIKRLDAIEHKPKALKAKIDSLQKGINDLVALVDARDATKQ